MTTLGANAFSYCSSLESINILSPITTLSDYLLAYCGNLTSVNLPSTLTSIGNWTFSYCTSLITMDIPEGVTSIGNYAFAYNTDLQRYTFRHHLPLSGIVPLRDALLLEDCSLRARSPLLGVALYQKMRCYMFLKPTSRHFRKLLKARQSTECSHLMK